MSAVMLPRAVRCALDLVEAEPANAWTLPKLAKAAGVAPRTLQKQFRRVLGKSPLNVIREARLARARGELLRGGASVTEVAVSCGFGHFGRFSADYRTRYGEAPSATLRRRRAFPLPVPKIAVTSTERPTLAVLPFEAMDGSVRLARGLTEEIVTSIAGARSVHLTKEPARYHLLGAVRQQDRRVRVTLRLVDGTTGRLLWADRQDGMVDDPFSLEDRVALAVARAVEPHVRTAEVARVQRKGVAELSSYELTMRALPAAMALDPIADSVALELLDRAIQLTPNDARPVALAAWCHVQRAAHHFSRSPVRERSTALALAQKAVALEAGDPLALAVLSGVYTLLHDLAAANALVEAALQLDSSLAWAWGRSGWVYCYRGEAAEAYERFQIALELAPGDPLTFLNHLGLAAAQFQQSRYEEAASWFKRAIAEHPQAVWANRFLAPAQALSGQKEEARGSCAILRQAFPDLTIEQVRTGLPFTARHLDGIAEGLAAAGMPRE